MPRVYHMQPNGESAHDTEAPRPSRWLYSHGLSSPTNGELAGDERSALVVHIVHEFAKDDSRPAELGPQGTDRCDVFCQSLVKVAHRGAPSTGQSRATPRNVSKSTFA